MIAALNTHVGQQQHEDYPGSRGPNEEREAAKGTNLKLREGPLASAVENLTSMFSTSLPCLHIERQ